MKTELKPINEWLAELARVGAEYGYQPQDCTEEIWGEYYRDGYSPLAAMQADVSEA